MVVQFVFIAALTIGPADVQIAPGSVVRWPGAGIESCALDGETFRPLDGACWIPAGLRQTGSLRASRRIAGREEVLDLEIAGYPYPEQRLTIRDESRVNLSAANLARVERENAQIDAIWSGRTPRRFTLPLGPPLDPLPKPGRFGSRRIINGEPRSAHTGVDFSVGKGKPVQTTDDGTVVLVGDFFFSGRSVFVDHGDGLFSMYFHLDEEFVREGQELTRGAVIGTVGSTGRSTGPHLHFGLRWRDVRVDPRLLLASPDGVRSVSP